MRDLGRALLALQSTIGAIVAAARMTPLARPILSPFAQPVATLDPVHRVAKASTHRTMQYVIRDNCSYLSQSCIVPFCDSVESRTAQYACRSIVPKHVSGAGKFSQLFRLIRRAAA